MDNPRLPLVWLLIARLDDAELPAVIPTLAWMAEGCGALLDCYAESPRSGGLFAPTGSLVVSGHHHQAWNYLHARADVRHIILGDPALFASTLALDDRTLARATTAGGIYRALLALPGVPSPAGVALIPRQPLRLAGGTWDAAPYLHPDIALARRLAFTDPAEAAAWQAPQRVALLVPPPAGWTAGETAADGDTLASITARIAARWRGRHDGVAFGDPAVVRAQLAWHCRRRRVTLWGEKRGLPRSAVRISAYVEDASTANAAAGAAAALAVLASST